MIFCKTNKNKFYENYQKDIWKNVLFGDEYYTKIEAIKKFDEDTVIDFIRKDGGPKSTDEERSDWLTALSQIRPN